MSKFKERAETTYKLNGPTVVHCSAGVGRTGSLIASQIAIEKLQKNQTVNIKQIVEDMRKQRHGLIQTGKQFEFVYRAIAEGTEKILKK